MAGVRHQTTGIRALTMLAVAGVAWAASAAPSELEAARQRLSAAREAAERAVQELKTLRTAGNLTQAELDDFRSYLASLENVVADNCERVMSIKSAQDDLTPEPGCHGVRGGGPVSFPDEQTEDEHIAALDARLGASMSDFDQLLLREMEQLKRRQSRAPDAPLQSDGAASGDGANGQQAGRQGEANGDAGPDGGEAQRSGEGEVAGSEQGGAKVATRSGSQQSGAHGGGQSGSDSDIRSPGRDQPPESGDDDIVARQLREAAEKETDPALREKLWEEYRRYKNEQRADNTAKSQQ